MEQRRPPRYYADVKYELQTIPVWDAYDQRPDCPLCHLAEQLEADYRSFFLGSAVMAPEMRVQVNRTGFCARHFAQLEEGPNRLGLALMTSTYLAARTERFAASRGGLERSLSGRAARGTKRRIEELVSSLATEEAGCMICERLERDIANYAFTILSLYRSEEAFRETFRASNGFCLPHLRTVLEVAADTARRHDPAEFLSTLFSIEDRSASELESGLEELAGSYDYRATGPPREDARRSLPRAISRLVGRLRRGI